MSIYEYKAVDANGKESIGLIEGDTIKSARRLLQSQELTVLEMIESKRKINQEKTWFKSAMSLADIALFTQQLASLLQAAMPIDGALQTIAKHNQKKQIQKTIQQIRSSVIEGKGLADSIQLNTKEFPPYYIATVEAGERSAKLGQVLEKLADEIQKREKFIKKISASLIYPALISAVALIVVISLLLFVVPQITTVFDNMNQALPPLTIAVINFSNLLSNHIEIILLLFVATIICTKFLLKQETTKAKIQKFLAKLPVIGRLLINSNAVRFSRTLSLLHESGTPILICLQNTAESLNYLPMKQGVLKALDKVSSGSTLFKALESQNILPPMTLYMLASGESSGQLSQMLNKAAETQESELDIYTLKIISIFEPIMILLMGGIVLLIVLAILLPIFELNQISL